MTTGTCVHAWESETADGPMSLGRCRNCGATGEFKNFVEGGSYGSNAVLFAENGRAPLFPSGTERSR